MTRLTPEEALRHRRLDMTRDFRYGMQAVVGFTLETIDDYWEAVEYYGAGFTDPTDSTLKPHYVYVMVNPSSPNISKIGFTTTSVSQRAAEINSATGVITPWVPVYSFKCPNGKMLEAEVHQYLEDRGLRINIKREGFEMKSEDAAKVIEELGTKYLTI